MTDNKNELIDEKYINTDETHIPDRIYIDAMVNAQEKNPIIIRPEMSPIDVKNQVNLIQEVMRSVMIKDEHYGIIPGCGSKPTLLKAGAEKLMLTFRLSPMFEIEQTILENGHKEYKVITTLRHIQSEKVIGQGVGSCSTLESKYRYRMTATTKKPTKEEAEELKRQGLGKWRKTGDFWAWYEKTENQNHADNYNTVLKIAKKRSLVDAVLTATAASDIFTQDIEEFPEQEINTTTGEIINKNNTTEIQIEIDDKIEYVKEAMSQSDDELFTNRCKEIKEWLIQKTQNDPSNSNKYNQAMKYLIDMYNGFYRKD